MAGITRKYRDYFNTYIVNYGLLPFVYFVTFCLFIMVDWLGQQNGSYNRIINGSMFLIVTIVLLWSYVSVFLKINKISKQLSLAVEVIENDYSKVDGYLWDQYKDQDPSYLFSDPDLIASFSSFQKEKKRLETIYSTHNVCSVGDYLSQDLIDGIANKNLLNIIPGVMTGLGILGTFIGLTLGLQNFNTGTSDEMMSSIPPLMDGIKIAFHTSIYGMVFSLAFNFVYKNILETSYDNLDNFLDIFSKYVCPDAEKEGISQLIYSQQKETEAVVSPIVSAVQSLNKNMTLMVAMQKEQQEDFRRLPDILGESIGKRVGEIIVPEFEKTNKSLESFATTISEMQLSSMGDLVDQFVSQMNESLSDSFTNLAAIISQTCDLQKQNTDYMQDILTRIGSMSLEIKEINELSAGTVQSMAGYVEKIENLQTMIDQNFVTISKMLEQHNQMEEKQQEYLEKLIDYEKQIGQASKQFSHDMAAQIELLGKLEKEITENTSHNLELLSTSAKEYNEALSEASRKHLQEVAGLADTFKQKSIEEISRAYQDAQSKNAEIAAAAKKEIQSIYTLADNTTNDMNRASKELGEVLKQLNGQLQQSLIATFDVFDKELSTISKHLSGTISEVDRTTNRVPKVVASAYEGMENSFEDMQKQMDSMIHMLDIMQRNMPDAVKKLLTDDFATQ